MVSSENCFLKSLVSFQILDDNALCPSLIPIDPPSVTLVDRRIVEVVCRLNRSVFPDLDVVLVRKHPLLEPFRDNLFGIVESIAGFLEKGWAKRLKDGSPNVSQVPIGHDI